MAQWLARGAHNPEVIGSNPISGIYHFAGLQELAHAVTTATLTPLAQRKSTQAHNLGVTGSKPVGGTITFLCGQAGPWL